MISVIQYIRHVCNCNSQGKYALNNSFDLHVQPLGNILMRKTTLKACRFSFDACSRAVNNQNSGNPPEVFK